LYFKKTPYYKNVRTICFTKLFIGVSMTIYISNISYKATKEDIDELFAPFGGVKNKTIPKDHTKNRMRGYAFIELEDLAQETHAIDALNNSQHMGRNIRVERSNYEKSPYFG
jgi:RNA recognition motif-containing protein